jgi:signaling intermediate in Toll pathway protein
MKPRVLPSFTHSRMFSLSNQLSKKETPAKESRITIKAFIPTEDKDKNTFLAAMDYFTREDVSHRRGHVEFIYSALKHMKEYGVNR